MSMLIRLLSLTAALIAFPIGLVADECKDVLDKNLMTRYEASSLSSLDAQIVKALSYDRETLKKIVRNNDKGFGISIPLAESLLSFGAKDKDKSDSLETLKESLTTREEGKLNSLDLATIRFQLAPEAAIKAWLDCKREEFKAMGATGLRATTVGNLNREFIVSLSWNRIGDSSPKSVRVAQVEAIGAEPVGVMKLFEGAKVSEFTPVEQRFRRSSEDEGWIRIVSEGYGPTEIKLPKLPPPPPRPPLFVTNITTETAMTRAIASPEFVPRHFRGDDTDFGGNGPRVTAKAWLTNVNGRIYLQVQMNAKETRSNWTEASETSALTERYLVYEAKANERVVSIDGPHQDRWQYTDTDHTTDNYSPRASFRAAKQRKRSLPGCTDSGFVERWTFVGDTRGNESGTRTSVKVEVNSVPITVERTEIVRVELVAR